MPLRSVAWSTFPLNYQEKTANRLKDPFNNWLLDYILCTSLSLGSPKKAKLANGPPDTSDVLCCEVCGKYGLRQDFSASGRFCGLSCVGVYTGRRNKGREFVRKVKTADGKIVKKKKKGKGKKIGLTEKMAGSVTVSNPLYSHRTDMMFVEP